MKEEKKDSIQIILLCLFGMIVIFSFIYLYYFIMVGTREMAQCHKNPAPLCYEQAVGLEKYTWLISFIPLFILFVLIMIEIISLIIKKPLIPFLNTNIQEKSEMIGQND